MSVKRSDGDWWIMSIRLSDREVAKTLVVGDRVFSDYHRGEEGFIRIITKVVKDRKFGSGYGAAATRGIDENGVPKYGGTVRGETCREGVVDAAWFRPVNLVVAEELMK